MDRWRGGLLQEADHHPEPPFAATVGKPAACLSLSLRLQEWLPPPPTWREALAFRPLAEGLVEGGQRVPPKPTVTPRPGLIWQGS